MLDGIGGRLVVIERMDGRIEPADAILQPHRAGDQLAQRPRQQRQRRLVAGIARSMRLQEDRKSTRLNSSHVAISYAVFCLKKKKKRTSNHNHHYTKKSS